jgi:hypothetical protein
MAPSRPDGVWLGGATTIVVLPLRDWYAPLPRGTLALSLWLSSVGTPSAQPQTSSAGSGPTASRDAPLAPLALVAGGFGNGSLTANKAPGGAQGIPSTPTAKGVTSLERDGSSDVLAASGVPAVSRFVVPQGPTASSFQPHVDTVAPRTETAPGQRESRADRGGSEGGLIELEPLPRIPNTRARVDKFEASPSSPRRRGSPPDAADGGAFWDELLELLSRAGSEADGSKPTPPVGKNAVVKPSPMETAATFNDGGAIELTAGAAATATQSTAPPVDRWIALDGVEITVDAGVAWFHAFEVGAAPLDVPAPPAAETPPAVPSPSEQERPGANEAEAAPRPTPAGLGLGLLAVLPVSLVRNRAASSIRDESRRKQPIGTPKST